MKDFAALVQQIGSSSKTNEKVAALAGYFGTAAEKDRVWTIAIFSGRRPKRFVNTRQLAAWCMAQSQLPAWLFEECYHTVGDLAETIALCLPPATDPPKQLTNQEVPLHQLIETFIALQGADETTQQAFVLQQWSSMDFDSRFVFNKLITGGFRIGVSQKMMVLALSRATGMEASLIAHRISGLWDPADTSFDQLLLNHNQQQDPGKPYPFYLAYQLDEPPGNLGNPTEWQAEWKWDGIRGQIIVRQGQRFVWSRGEELMTDRFPEFAGLEQSLPDGCCLDGELMCLQEGAEYPQGWMPMPFAALQTRIGRKTVSKKQLQEAPVGFVAYDLLEKDGKDLRQRPLAERRNMLQQLLGQHPARGIFLSPAIAFDTWETLARLRQTSREQHSEGLMLKRLSSAYQVGRKVGDWWKWKIDPLTIDAVMIYAQKGHGRRSNLYTDYTFAVKDGNRLVPFTKAYSGLTDKEFAEVDAFVKRHALEKFGPVRTVKPELVFEIAFEGIAASNRHKSGVALRFPRISRWRKDKKPEDINTLLDLQQLLLAYGPKA